VKAVVAARLLTLMGGLLPALGQPALAPEADPDLLRLAPPLGVVVRKTWVTSGKRELERLEVRTGEVTSEPQHLSILLTGSKRLVVEDRQVRVEDGRSLEFTREYKELDARRTLQTTTVEEEDTVLATDTCDVEGRTVRFLWNGDGYDRTFTDEPAKGEVESRPVAKPVDGALTGLAADMDLLAFLPTDPVAVGAEWSVAFERFRDVLRPGGRLSCTTEPPEGAGERELSEAVWDSLAGDVVARYAGRDEQVSRITFRGTFSGSGEKKIAQTGMTGRRMTSRMQVEGELVWDRGHGCARRLTMKRSGTVTTTDDIVIREEGFDRSFERELRFLEESELEVVFEVLPVR
jgi:hypothetical protein